MSETAKDVETGTPTLWDNAWREGHAHGLAAGLGISYREGYLRTVAMLAGKPLDLSRLKDSVQTQNDRGEWVPSIPEPLYGLRKQCGCGHRSWTKAGYRGHYALAHILATP